jgi:hypothetical protein
MIKTMLIGLLAMAQAAGGGLVAEMQAVESARNAAIRTGDRAALERLYAADFQGIAGSGGRVDHGCFYGAAIASGCSPTATICTSSAATATIGR